MGVLPVLAFSCRLRVVLLSRVVERRQKFVSHWWCSLKKFSLTAQTAKMHGLVLGVYTAKDPSAELSYTASTKAFDEQINGKLSETLKSCKKFTPEIKVRLFYNLLEEFPLVSVVHLGDRDAAANPLEFVCEKKENVRVAVAAGVKYVAHAGAESVFVDDCGEPECAAEAANLILFRYDELKDASSRKQEVTIDLYRPEERTKRDWDRGKIKANAQKFAMTLMEAPANMMTPRRFAERVKNQLQGLPVELIVRDKSWAESMKMGSFLSVAQGSHEEPLFVELHYNGGKKNDAPAVLVGKGITFDSGGISLKPSAAMDEMRADMGGGAVVVSSIYAAAVLGLKLNIKGIVPLCENMVGGRATKPGDVVFAMNGKSIQVDNTDAEGRLILADGLAYAQSFKPAFIVDVATLTGAMCISLGSAASGAFTNDQDTFDILRKAGYETGDRIWQMPLFKHYLTGVKDCQLADLKNVGKRFDGGACFAAAFLREFVGDYKWIHIDMAGVMGNGLGSLGISYLPKGMSGRPTRTVIEFLKMFSEQL